MRAPSLPNTPSTLVGRDRELGILREYLDAALAKRGNLVLIGGEAGIGKTALAEALCRDAVQQGALVLVGRCYDLTETPPYGPWVELFARYQPESDDPPLSDAFARRGTVGEVTNQAALFQQVADFFTTLADVRPVILLLDDLHWADPASLDLLRFLTRNLATLPLLALVTYRSEELTRRHPLYRLLPLLVRESGAQRLDLGRFGDEALHALIHTRYLLRNADETRLVAYLVARAEGNALFTLELLRTLEEQGVLRQDGGWRLGEIEYVQVPMLLKQVIEGRLVRLGEDAVQLLRVAAVIGQEVPLVVWAQVADSDEDTLLSVVEAAEEARVFGESQMGEAVQFAHALIREALYEGIPSVRRRRLHRQVGEALAGQRNPDPDAVAYQFQQAGDLQAAEWLVRAGDRACRAYARLTAADRYDTALASLPETETETRGWVLYRRGELFHDQHSLDYLTEALRLAEAIGDQALAALARYSHGLMLCRREDTKAGYKELVAGAEAIEVLTPGERSRLRAVPGPAAAREAPQGAVILWSARVGQFAHGLALAERWLIPQTTFASSAGGAALADGWAGLTYIHTALGRLTDARAAYARAQQGYVRQGDWRQVGNLVSMGLDSLTLRYEADRVTERERVQADAIAAIRRVDSREVAREWVSALLRFIEGRWDDPSFALAEAALSIDSLKGAHNRARLLLAQRHRARGNRAEAWALLNAAIPYGTAMQPGDAHALVTMDLQRLAAALTLDEGDQPATIAWLQVNDRWLAWSGAALGQAEHHLLWADYHRAAGDAEAAYRSAQQAHAHASEPRQPLALLAAHRLLGELDTDAGRFSDAARHLDASLVLAAACAAPYERSLTLLATAQLHVAAGGQADVGTLLDEVRTICVPLGARPTLDRADTLAVRLAATRDAPPVYPAGLSAREVEVLCLLASGKTNREIAETLFLSERTIDAHVRNILTKTRTDNRAAAAHWAAVHDLT